jgi:hypothetical protein
MLVGVLAGFVLYQRNENHVEKDMQFTRAEVYRMQREVALQSTLAQVERNERGYPLTINPEWFGYDLPRNPLLPEGHPWLEIAGPAEKDLEHPPVRVAYDRSLAKFWYNPSTGMVRARIPGNQPDPDALRMYNTVNDCSLPNLYTSEERGRRSGGS